MGFYEELNKHYDKIFPTGTMQLDFIKKRINGEKVLDVACGTGNYSIPLAKDGHQVSSIDLDEGMIALLKKKAEKEGVTINAIAENMEKVKELYYGNEFNMIFCIGNSLVHLNNLKDIERLIADFSSLLTIYGTLIIQIINYDRILKDNIDGLPTIVSTDNKSSLTRKYRFDSKNCSIHFDTQLTVEEDGRFSTYENSVPLYPLTSKELVNALKKGGFKEIDIYGGFNEEEYSINSYGMVIAARKKGGL